MTKREQIYLRIGEIAEKLGVTTKTIRRWEKIGKISVVHRTIGNHRRYSIQELERIKRGNNPKEEEKILVKKAYIYSRVSTQEQKEDLERQIATIVHEVNKDSYEISGIYKDIGSGLNDNRRGLKRLLRDCYKSKGLITRVYITFRDRLARFGTKIIEEILSYLGIELMVINEKNIHEGQQGALLEEFMQDFVSIFTSFTGKWYAMRRKWKTTD